jgi:hypothetical protein
MATAYPGGLRKRGGLLDEFMAPDYSYLARRAELTPAQNTRGLVDYLRDEYPRIYGAGAGLLQSDPYETANAYGVFDPNRKAAFEAAQLAFPVGLALDVIPGVGALKRPAMAVGRAGERLAERVVPQVMERGGLLSEMVGAMGQGTQSYAYRPTTPKKPDPSVGTRFEREFLGGLAPKTPVKIEDYQGASALLMPWDSTSRNYKIKSISDELLPTPIITHGGQDYARDIAHLEQGIGGASGLSIAKRIRDRDAQARIENIMAGGTGEILHLPTTMGAGAENFSVMPSEILMGLLDLKTPNISAINQIDNLSLIHI